MANGDTRKQRRGSHKRKMQDELGTPKRPAEKEFKTAQEAHDWLMQMARAELATGYSTRVEPVEDIAAFSVIEEQGKEIGRELSQRRVSPAFFAGAALIAKELDAVETHAGQSAGGPAEPDELAVAQAAKFVIVRRKGIARVAKGEKNRALRHSFGISQPMNHKSLAEVRAACVALVAGRARHAKSAAALMLTEGDMTMARGYVQRLTEIQSRNGAQRSSQADSARTRDVLHCALELFYDRFGAAVEMALENDDAARVALLSLIPRRKERRAQAQKPPAQVQQPAVTKTGTA